MKVWVYLILAGAVALLFKTFQNRGVTIHAQKDQISALASTTANQASTINTLTTENATLSVDNANLGKANEGLKRQKAEATTSAVIAGAKLAETSASLQRTASQLSAIKAKQEADKLVGGVGAIETVVADSILNRKVASLKAQITNLESVAKGLQESIAGLQQERSELEEALNGPDGSRAKLAEKVRQLAEVRSLVQTKRAEARGLFAGKRRKVLGEVDAKLGQGQN